MIFKSKIILQNKDLFITKCNEAYSKVSEIIKSKDTTWNYKLYNIFSVTSGDEYFYELFKELKKNNKRLR